MTDTPSYTHDPSRTEGSVADPTGADPASGRTGAAGRAAEPRHLAPVRSGGAGGQPVQQSPHRALGPGAARWRWRSVAGPAPAPTAAWDPRAHRGDTIIDATADPFVAGAAGAGGLTYLPVHSCADLTELAERLTGAAGLVLLRGSSGEPDSDPDPAPELASVFGACHRLMAPGGCTVAVLVPVPIRTDYADMAQLLVPVACTAGPGYLQHIVAITTPVAAPPASAGTAVQMDLLVFVTGHRHG